jgi:hypothetical protein
MGMIAHEGPGKDPRSGRFSYLTDSGSKALTVFVIPKNIGPLDTPNHNMVKRPGCIQSRLSCHINTLSQPILGVNTFVNIVNYVPKAVPSFPVVIESWMPSSLNHFQ